MNINVNNDKILDKIKKCLALSKSSEPHEAAAALRQAQKLMSAHGVSETSVKLSEVCEQDVKSKFSVSQVKPYEFKLINIIAKAFGCKVLWKKAHSSFGSKDYYGKFILIGMKSRIDLCAYTCEVMQRKMYTAKNKFVKTLDSTAPRDYKTAQSNGFMLGWATKIEETVKVFAGTSEESALIEKFIESKGKTKTGKLQNARVGQHGMQAGVEAASGESIHRPMRGQDQLRLK